MNRIILVTVALLCGSAAFSQIHKMERSDSSLMSRTYTLNPVVVTGSGHHQRLKSTATPVHVLSRQEIKEQGITTFDGALTRMMPQVSMAPNSMGTFLRLNGLGNKYILILINGHNKARALAATVEGEVSQKWTCSALQRHNGAIIACDEAACGELTVDTYKYFLDIERTQRL